MKIIFERRDKMSEKSTNQEQRPTRNDGTEKRGFSLPPTSSKPPMPPVNPPKKKD